MIIEICCKYGDRIPMLVCECNMPLDMRHIRFQRVVDFGACAILIFEHIQNFSARSKTADGRPKIDATQYGNNLLNYSNH